MAGLGGGFTFTYNKTLPTAPRQRSVPQHVYRQQRLTPTIYSNLVRFAFDVLDPQMTGEIAKELLNDIRDTLADLVRNNASTEARERIFFIQEFGEEKLNGIEEEETKALCQSVDLTATKDDNDCESEDEYDDDDPFIAPSEEDEEGSPKQLEYKPPSRRVVNAPDPVFESEELEDAIALARSFQSKFRQKKTSRPKKSVDSEKGAHSRRKRQKVLVEEMTDVPQEEACNQQEDNESNQEQISTKRKKRVVVEEEEDLD